MNSNNASIPRAGRPEEVGVSSAAIAEYVRDIEESGIESHSLMVIRHGKVACEAFREPFGPEYKHMMYSVSKSFTSAAIGFAVEEGYISLETKFADIFPESRGDKPDAYLEKMSVEDLLTL